MDANSSLEITNLQVLIGLWRKEEDRLGSLISNPLTSPNVRSQARERLREVVQEISEATQELVDLEAAL